MGRFKGGVRDRQEEVGNDYQEAMSTVWAKDKA
jgi:hypothetical protein